MNKSMNKQINKYINNNWTAIEKSHFLDQKYFFEHPQSVSKQYGVKTDYESSFRLGSIQDPKCTDMHLHLMVWKKYFYNFLYKIDHVYVYIKYKENNSSKNLFFIFPFYNTLTAKLEGNSLVKKMPFSSNHKV